VQNFEAKGFIGKRIHQNYSWTQRKLQPSTISAWARIPFYKPEDSGIEE